MCGVTGILYKHSRKQGLAPIGEDLVKMLEALTHRGKDSSGLTVVGEHVEGDLVIRIWTQDADQREDVLVRVEETVAQAGGVVNSRRAWGRFLRLTVNYEGAERLFYVFSPFSRSASPARLWLRTLAESTPVHASNVSRSATRRFWMAAKTRGLSRLMWTGICNSRRT